MKADYTLYLCTDRSLMTSGTLSSCVEQAIMGGVTAVQLREKHASSRDFYNLGCEILQITRSANVPLIINDRLDIALAVGADGVHLGQSDLPVDVVRRIAGKDMIIGATAHNVAEAVRAAKLGADYLGVGAVAATSTKMDTVPITRDELIAVRKAVDIPVVIIGGISAINVCDFKGLADGIAVVSAIVAKPDIEKAARELKTLWTK